MTWKEYRRLARAYRRGLLGRDRERLERLLCLAVWADTMTSRELAYRLARSFGWSYFTVCLDADPALAWVKDEPGWRWAA